MSTTDRMPELNSQRQITDRVGQTVVLGNSVVAGAVSESASIVAAAAGASLGVVPLSVNTTATLSMYNGSFGLWSVFANIEETSLLQLSGASIAGARFNDLPISLLTWGADAVLINVQVITATGVYTPTTGTVSIVVQALGGGAGGGGAAATAGNNSAAAGGGAGALATARITSGFSGVTVTIGAGGAGGAAGNNNGSNGGATTFGSVLTAGGGVGGAGSPAAAVPLASAVGTGGNASGSASLFGAAGENGRVGYALVNTSSVGGGGGSSAYGAGGDTRVTGTSVAGRNATGFGAGGGGGAVALTNSAVAGGTGTSGICIIWEYNG